VGYNLEALIYFVIATWIVGIPTAIKVIDICMHVTSVTSAFTSQ